MGNFFTSICTRASMAAVTKALKAAMKEIGFRTNNRAPEFTVILQPYEDQWLCIHSDQFDSEWFGEWLEAFYLPMKQPVLAASCVDSDFVQLDLYHGDKTGSACIGQPYDEPAPKPDPAFWQPFVGNFAAFSEILNKKYVFAEEGLLALGYLLGFDGNMLLPSDEPADGAVILGFSRAAQKESPSITSGYVQLAYPPRSIMPQPYSLYRNSYITLINLGGPGKGIKIVIEAEFPGEKPLPFDICETHLRYAKYQMGTLSHKWGGVIPAPTPVEFECIENQGCRSVWQAILPEFELPEGFNPNYKYASRKKESDSISEKTIIFNYRLRIPEHLRILNFCFIPLENPTGEYLWRVEDCWQTPQEREIFERDGSDAYHEYMRNKHKQNTKDCT